MPENIKLNDDVHRICRTHWGPVDTSVKARCFECPLMDECTAPVGAGNENLQRWIVKCNQKAIQITNEEKAHEENSND